MRQGLLTTAALCAALLPFAAPEGSAKKAATTAPMSTPARTERGVLHGGYVKRAG